MLILMIKLFVFVTIFGGIFIGVCLLLNRLLKKRGDMIYICGIFYVIEVLQYSLPSEIKIPLVTTGINLAFFQLWSGDIVAILMLIVLLFCANCKLKKYGPVPTIYRGMILFSAICVISALLGLANISDTNWLADLRNNFRLVISVAYFYRFRKEINLTNYIIFIKKIITIVMLYACVLWGLYLILGIKVTPQSLPLRIIQPNQIIVIAYYAMYSIYTDLHKKNIGHISMFSICCILCVILDEYRTVWISLVVGIIIMVLSYILEKGLSVKLFWLITQTLMTVVIVFALSLLLNSDVVNSVINLSNSFSNLEDSSWSTRTNLWNGLIDSLHGMQYLIGQPFGAGYDGGLGWTTAPHSGWIEILMRTGVLGTLGLIISLIKSLYYSRYCSEKPLIVSWVFMIIVYFAGYSFTLDTGVLLGFIMIFIERGYYKMNGREIVQ